MLKDIYIQFTKPAKHKFPILSWIIRKIQKTPYSHVRLTWKTNSGEPLIYEASGSSVHLVGSKAAPYKPVKVVASFRLKVTYEEYKKMIMLFRFAGVKYGFKQLLGILLVYMFNLKKNPLADGRKSQVCSELVGLFLKEVKGWETNMDLDVAGPKEVYEALEELCKKYPKKICLEKTS